ncbi:MAG: nicotinate-nucleotide adenylyltransferase [Paludibacteraceae bacterium]|nr:nicotinate-nucleotide adenylyltransferase [Paludibacteraceae bacterium]
MTTCIFPGSFNPIHNGHINLAQYVLDNCEIDELWLMVSPENPLKTGLYTVSAQDRLAMLNIAVKERPSLRASDYELKLPTPTYTCNTLRSLKCDFPDRDFALLVGADNMVVFDRWREYQFIIDNFPILVYPRPGIDIEKLKIKYPTMRIVDGAPQFEVSSTQIRQRIVNGANCDTLLDREVLKYIKRKKLYRVNAPK